MEFLPPVDIRDVQDEEETGDFVACRFSDDEEDNHDDDCECVLCAYGDGGSGEAHQVLSRMEEIDQQMVGKVSDDEIHRLQAELYNTHVLEPLKRQGIDAPVVTAEMCRKHFSKHRLNIKRMVGSEINFVNTMQRQVRRENILSRNNVTGQTRIDSAALKNWLHLSKHKLDLVKFYNGAMSKGDGKKTQNIKPYSFS